mmetsp:Transcript_14991/g.17867  ORF Transcript_14991/g.17867 Transcript_14991/m.17867 type:complete len:211 (+) Transcript_14991:37-669(+)
MADWTLEQVYRDFWSRPLSYPLLRMYGDFMDIRRYDRMPFYFAPLGGQVVSYEDRIINLLDWAVDAHEEARNTEDRNRDFYQRAVYCQKNYLRYQNDTVCNLMYDVQAPRPVYDKINATVDRGNFAFYLSAAAVHAASFMYMSFFFRYRRVTALPTLAIGSAYYIFFENVNNIMYKLIVDRPVLQTTRRLGFAAQAQPVGTAKNRGLNYI